MRNIYAILFLCAFLSFNSTQAQRSIKGVVSDELNNPIYGVNVSIKGTNLQVSTDDEGTFSFEINNYGKLSLFFSSLSSVATEREIPAGTQPYTLHIVLQEKVLGLPTIDIVGASPQSYRSDIANSATRIDIPVMEIPGTVGVVSRKLMEDQQITGLSEALRNVSGVTARPSGFNLYDVFVARGFSLTNSRNYFRNGIRFLKFSNSPISNIERVEVLKGPASVLYGAVEPGGIINFITKPTLPNDKYGIVVRYGSNDFKQASADITGPIGSSKKVRYRMNALKEKSNSFRDKVESNLNHISPVLDIDLGPQTLLSFDADFFWNDRTFDPGSIAIKNKVLNNGRNTFLSEPWTYGKFKDINFGYKLSHEFNSNLKFRSYFRHYFIDEDRLYLQMRKLLKDDRVERRLAKWYADIKYYAFLNEVVYKVKTLGVEHNILGGVEFGRYTNRKQVTGAMYTPVNIFKPTYTDAMPQNLKMKKSTDLYSKQFTSAIYIQDQISLSDKLKLLIGARADWIDNESENYARKKNTTRNDFAISPRGGLVYIPSQKISAFISYSESYVPRGGQTRDGKDFKPIESKQIEVGAKASLFNEKLLASLALFDLRRQNLPTPDPIDPAFRIQIGEQYSKGIEIDISGEITPSWSISANFSHIKGEVSKTNDKRFPVGNKLSNSPKNRYSLWSSYRFRTGKLKGFSAGGGYFFVGERFGDLRNSFTMDNYATVDGFLSYRRDFYKLSFNLKNIFDKEYHEGANNRMVIRSGIPRTFMVSLSLLF